MKAYYVGCALAGMCVGIMAVFYDWHFALKIYSIAFLVGNLVSLPATIMLAAAPPKPGADNGSGKRTWIMLKVLFILAPAAPIALPVSTLAASIKRNVKK